MYYLRYFIKCCIRNISRMICKPKILFTLLLILLLLFCFTKLESNATEIEKTPLNVEYLESRTIGGNINSTTMQGQMVDFGGFYCFFAPINYKGQTVGFNVQTSQTCEVRYGFAEYVSVGTPVFYFGQTTTSEVGNIATKTNITCPIDKGFFIVCVYQGYAVTDISMYSQDTVAEIVGNSTQTILEGQQQIRDDIVQGQNEINDTLTSTDYDESVVNIDSSAVDDVDDSSSTQLFTTIFTNFSDLLDNTNWSEVEVIQLGLPYTDKKIELRSDILSSIVRGSALSILITISWYSLFGLYCFRFVTHIYHSIKSGDILNGLSLKDEVITSTML